MDISHTNSASYQNFPLLPIHLLIHVSCTSFHNYGNVEAMCETAEDKFIEAGIYLPLGLLPCKMANNKFLKAHDINCLLVFYYGRWRAIKLQKPALPVGFSDMKDGKR